jgi:electron transport complex protein RnfB
MLSGTFALLGLAVGLASVLLLGARVLASREDTAVERVERVLPRIHCGQCGYDGCRPYAQALVAGTAPINLCPPGGEETIRQLAELLGAEPLALAAERGRASLEQVAHIDEAACIGCNLCARACPVDAIIGIPQMMHTIVASACTGCERCLAPCPVDCIVMRPRHA